MCVANVFPFSTRSRKKCSDMNLTFPKVIVIDGENFASCFDRFIP